MANDFSTLGVSKELVNFLKQNGITEPTPVQEQSIPPLLERKDVIAKAQTGTGKTLAFLLPALERIDTAQTFVQALVVTPTRELALQITNEARKLAPLKSVNILAAYGGQDVEQQVRKLKGAIHLVVATPGRLLDHIRRKTVDLSRIRMLVLDEADQMLDMGFLKEVEQIIHKTPQSRQTMLFSATMPVGIQNLASRYMRDPVKISVKSKRVTLDEIKQVVIETTDRAKQDALCKVIEEYKPFMAIIFCRTKRRASTLNEALQRQGYNSDELHGDLTQAKREKVMKAFREVQLQYLVATDVAARGLDIEGVTHIFNYDIPQDVESYIHRIGRTGRAGQTGVAVTFATPKDREILNIIEKGIKTTLEKRRILNSDTHVHNEAPDREKRHLPKKGGFVPKGFGRGQGDRTGRKSSERFGERRPGAGKRPSGSGRSRTGKAPANRRPS